MIHALAILILSAAPVPQFEQRAPVPVFAERPAAEKWVKVGEPVQLTVSQRVCGPGECRIVQVPNGQTAQLWQWEPTGQWAHIVSNDVGVLGIWYYDGPIQTLRWVEAPKFSKDDKKYFTENHWRFSMPTCNMWWCQNHGGGWILEANRVPEK